MSKKNKLIDEASTSIASLKHDAHLQDQIIERQKIELDKKDTDKKDVVNKLKKLEIEHKKTKDQHKTDVEALQNSVGNLAKSNSDLTIKVASQQTYIESIEEGFEEPNEQHNIEGSVENIPQRVIMSKESPEHRCQACDKLFKEAGDLDKHMKDRHTESDCHMCNKTFTTRKEAKEHICTEGEIVPQKCEKSYCKKEYASSEALINHMKRAHFGNQRKVCNMCSEILNANDNMKKHNETCGRVSQPIRNKEKSPVVCKHWRRGKCDRGTTCNFSHVGRQDPPRQEYQSTDKTIIPCRNGPSCSFLARSKCDFGHHMTRSHQVEQERRQWQSQGRPRTSHRSRHQEERIKCRFGAQCDKVPNCPFLHSMEDFPQYNTSHGFRATRRARNNTRQ